MKKTRSRPQCEASLKQKRPQEGGMGGMGSLWDWVKHVIFWVLFQRMSWLWIVQTEKECIRIVPLAHWPQILTLPLKQSPHGSIKSSCIACKTKRWKSGLLPGTLHQGSCGKGASKSGCQWIDSRENLGESMALPQIWSLSFFPFIQFLQVGFVSTPLGQDHPKQDLKFVNPPRKMVEDCHFSHSDQRNRPRTGLTSPGLGQPASWMFGWSQTTAIAASLWLLGTAHVPRTLAWSALSPKKIKGLPDCKQMKVY